MLTLFVLKSGAPDADADRAEKSFAEIALKMIRVDSLKDIYQHNIDTLWYGIIYDNEQADMLLQTALPVFLAYSNADVMILFKKNSNGKASRAPRIFKQGIAVRTDCLLPVNEAAIFDSVLNGWLL
uniref:Uncharacterized protein n=1 Tax=viral metagenome TaxID=1070528 RepID=A0A6M3IHJ8_9ZZZZ